MNLRVGWSFHLRVHRYLSHLRKIISITRHLFKIFRIITAVLFVTIVHSDDYYKGDTLVRKGVHAFYNYEFDKAVDILNQARVDFPDHPGVHLIWAASRWVRSQANSPVEETYRILNEDLKEIGPVYDSLVDRFEYDPNYKLYQGSEARIQHYRISNNRKECNLTGKIVRKVVPEIAMKSSPIQECPIRGWGGRAPMARN